jgi:hypothetical protein
MIIMGKNKKKKTSSRDFGAVYDAIFAEGRKTAPTVKYKDLDRW